MTASRPCLSGNGGWGEEGGRENGVIRERVDRESEWIRGGRGEKGRGGEEGGCEWGEEG